MLDIQVVDGEVRLGGVFDASQVPTAEPVFDEIRSTAVINFKDLECRAQRIAHDTKEAERGRSRTETHQSE